MDRKESLNNYISTFSNISSEADNLIKNNGYDAIQFYGIILSYLNYYDYKNFQKCFTKLYNEKNEILFEILHIYNSNFINPINQDLEFFEKFIGYIVSRKESIDNLININKEVNENKIEIIKENEKDEINKNFLIFENLLNFILDIETFIIVIDKTKEQIAKNYVSSDKNDFKTIKIKSNLALKKKEKGKEMDCIIPAIESIINFSREQKILLIYFSSNFWINILKHYNKPFDLNINICYRLREIFHQYNDLVNDLFKDDKNERKSLRKGIKNDINKYFDKDEFAFLLDKNIKLYFEINKNISNDECVGLIKEYDPYYKEDKYKSKRDPNIFDYINFDQIDKQFIETFKKLEFEIVFKDSIMDFLNKMISKINNVNRFSIIIELIDINKISTKKEYLSQLRSKYEYVVKNKINSLNGEKLYDAIQAIAKFSIFLFNQDKNCDFLEQIIDKLNRKISPLAYNELIKRCQSEEYK